MILLCNSFTLCLVSSVILGSGAGLYPKASRLFLYQERAELARWLDARKQKEDGGW